MADETRSAAPELDVDALPRRIAHAVHALLAVRDSSYGPYGPFTAAEVCEYDNGEDAFTPRHTAAALREAQKLQLAMYVPGIGEGYWTATHFAINHRREFEDRFMRDTEQEGDE